MKWVLITAATYVAASAGAGFSYEDIIAVVEAAEGGTPLPEGGTPLPEGGEGLDRAIEVLKDAGGVAPLAAAGLGRLWALKASETGFSLLRITRARRGFAMLDDYVAAHPEDPYGLLWRGRSAIETNYLIADGAAARRDLEKALKVFDEHLGDREMTALCCLALGSLAFDFGDLARARTYWELAVINAPDTAHALKAAELLNLTQG